MNDTLIHQIVICSNRGPDALNKVIESIKQCTFVNEIKLLIVNNDSTLSASSFHQLIESHADAFADLLVIHSSPGLVNARNAALNCAECDVITFIDDDVAVPQEFHVRILSKFLSDSELVGCSPYIAGEYDWGKSSNWLRTFNKKKLKKHLGKVTKSGENYWFYPTSNINSQNVDWLPGCCMSYSFPKVSKLTFSASLQNGPTEGYSLGEDVDFSLRARQFGQLELLESLQIQHFKSPSARDNSTRMAFSKGMWLIYLAKNHNEKVKISSVLSHQFLQILYQMLRIVFMRKNSIKELSQKVKTIQGMLFELIRPRLVD
jgi:GT2 family glycosyltransferase